MFSWKRFFQAAMTRAVRTMAQTALASLTACVTIQDVDIHLLAGSVALSGVYSLLTALATGLPEVPEGVELKAEHDSINAEHVFVSCDDAEE